MNRIEREYKLMYDAFEININTHEDALFCISLFLLLLFCYRNYSVKRIPEHTNIILAESKKLF